MEDLTEHDSERDTNEEQPQKEKVFVSPQKTTGLKRKKSSGRP